MPKPCQRSLLSSWTILVLGCSFAILLWEVDTVHGQSFPDLLSATENSIGSDDLIRLTTAFAEGAQEYKTADLRLKTLRSLGANASLTGLETQVAQIQLNTAASKLQVLQAIGEKFQLIAKARVDFFRQLEKENGERGVAGGKLTSPLRQAEGDLRIVNMILAMNPLNPAALDSP